MVARINQDNIFKAPSSVPDTYLAPNKCQFPFPPPSPCLVSANTNGQTKLAGHISVIWGSGAQPLHLSHSTSCGLPKAGKRKMRQGGKEMGGCVGGRRVGAEGSLCMRWESLRHGASQSKCTRNSLRAAGPWGGWGSAPNSEPGF